MYAARLVIALLLILAVMAAYNPQAREQAVESWERIRPVVAEITDSLYMAVRNLITGNASGDGTEETPVPAPGTNFERIVTMNSSSVS